MKNVFYEIKRDLADGFYAAVDLSSACVPHFHRNYEITYITQGRIKALINERIYIFEEDDIIFTHHYYNHEHLDIGNCIKIVLIPNDAYCTDFEYMLKEKTLPCHLNDKEFNRSLKPLFASAILNNSEYADKNILHVIQKGLLSTIVAKLLSNYKTVEIYNSGGSKFIYEILGYIDKNYAKPLTLELLAQKFGYNKHYLSRLWNRQISYNLNTYINTIRIQRAVEKAQSGSYNNISSLAFDCGFDSLTTFYRYFSKLYDSTPKKLLGLKQTD